MSDLRLDGMALADGVVETIVSIAMGTVEDAVLLGGAASLLAALGNKGAIQPIEVKVNENNTLSIGVHVEAVYGTVLPELAARIRQAVSDAVQTQVGVEVSDVDVYIDGIQFVS